MTVRARKVVTLGRDPDIDRVVGVVDSLVSVSHVFDRQGPPRTFARVHVAGTVSIELGDPFATYDGWTLPWQAPVGQVGR
jgi:hypothetical protein